MTNASEFLRRNTIHVENFKMYVVKKFKDFLKAWGGVWPSFLCPTFGKSTPCYSLHYYTS
jgi:hypothetical protein